MRLSGRWMVLVDDRVLEFLREEGPHAPSSIADDDRIPYGRQHVGDRCRMLDAYGLLDRVGNGVYAITDDGERYLDGDRDTRGWGDGV